MGIRDWIGYRCTWVWGMTYSFLGGNRVAHPGRKEAQMGSYTKTESTQLLEIFSDYI
jgi:hypothetical protein